MIITVSIFVELFEEIEVNVKWDVVLADWGVLQRTMDLLGTDIEPLVQ